MPVVIAKLCAKYEFYMTLTKKLQGKNVFSYHSDNLTKCQTSKDSAQTHWTHKPVNSKYSHCHCVDNVLTQCREAKCCVDTVYIG